MSTQDQLKEVFADNFVAYFKSHVAHVNIMGRNFYSDHKILQKIYEELQDQIDVIAELLRSLDAFMPDNLDEVMSTSSVKTSPIFGSADDLLAEVRDDLLQLKECYIELMEIASEEQHEEIENYAQERVLSLAKHIWQLNATLD